MASSNSDKAWEYFGKTDPYFGVLTHPQYSGGQLSDEAKKEFFATGELYVDGVARTIREHFDPAFRPERALDFGCGVGRLVLPLARISGSVVGVDVSQSMLAVAEENARKVGLNNVTFAQSDDTLSRVSGKFGFVHSFIVFQHIPPKRGVQIFKALVDLLVDDGIGALHVTYAPAGSVPAARTFVTTAKRTFPNLAGVVSVLRGRSFRNAFMQMNAYDLNELFRLLQESGCHQIYAQFSETSVDGHPFYGVTLFFRKRALDVKAHA